jgi:hypothetical protein
MIFLTVSLHQTELILHEMYISASLFRTDRSTSTHMCCAVLTCTGAHKVWIPAQVTRKETIN